jgi:hypothetical protein
LSSDIDTPGPKHSVIINIFKLPEWILVLEKKRTDIMPVLVFLELVTKFTASSSESFVHQIDISVIIVLLSSL